MSKIVKTTIIFYNSNRDNKTKQNFTSNKIFNNKIKINLKDLIVILKFIAIFKTLFKNLFKIIFILIITQIQINTLINFKTCKIIMAAQIIDKINLNNKKK